MKIKALMVVSAAAVFAGYGSAALADAKATFNDVCSECHETADFEGENAAELAATIKKISAGQMKHHAQGRQVNRSRPRALLSMGPACAGPRFEPRRER